MNNKYTGSTMQELTGDSINNVSGGIFNFFVGWLAGKGLDSVVDSAVESAHEFSEADHSGSNEYFLENRDQFNPLI